MNLSKNLILGLYILIFLCVFIYQCKADELGKFEDQFKKNRTPPQEGEAPDESSHKFCRNILDCIIGSVFSRKAPSGKPFNQEKFLILSYPYVSDNNNYLFIDSFERGRHYAYTFSPSFQRINPNTEGYAVNFDFRDYLRFGFSSDYIHFRESSAQQSRQLDFFALYLFIVPSESNNVIFDLGLGEMGLSGHDHFLGPAFTMGWTLFPHKPILIKAHVSLGGFNWVPIWDLGGEVGYMAGPVEIYLGYRSLVGPEADLTGPLGGIRYWF